VSRNVFAMYGEFNIPIVKTVEANVAVRWDDYSDFGSTVNPKISLRWQPTKDVLLRGAWGSGFRAPSLYDLYGPQLVTNTADTYDDPIRCPVTGDVQDCNTQFSALRGGNANLQPEKSTQWYAGVIWEPTQQLSLGLDYYWIEIEDVITFIDASQIFGNPALEAAAFVRCPSTPDYPNLPGPLQGQAPDGSYCGVKEANFNLTKQQTSGIDLSATFRQPTDFGRFSLNLTGSYVFDFKQTNVEGTEYPNFVGTRGVVGAISRWRHFASLDWIYGGWGATLAQTFQNGYSEEDLTSDDPNATRRVGSYSVWDLQGRYTGFKNTTLTLGIKNLFNTAPPVSNQGNTFQVGYDPTYGDPRGMIYYGSLRYAFK
jgi:iron complex outermembrane receptor protein